MLFAVAAPSGTGKTSIVKEVLKKHSDLVFSVSATTRKKRNDETDGKDYYFIEKKDFLEKIEQEEFIEFECVFGRDYYGTLKSVINKYIGSNINVIFDLDVNGAISLKNVFKDFIVLIFIKPPDKQAVIKRLKNRGTENESQIAVRLKRFDLEMSKINEFDYVVINDNLLVAIEKVNGIITKFKNKLNKNNKE